MRPLRRVMVIILVFGGHVVLRHFARFHLRNIRILCVFDPLDGAGLERITFLREFLDTSESTSAVSGSP